MRRPEEKIVIEFLPVMGNLERALAHAEGERGSLLEGVAMVHKQFLAVLERFDIRPFESLDAPFDPEKHEAIQQAHSDREIGTVCQVMQKGYRRGERLVRPALVVVSLGPAPREPLETTAEPSPPEAAQASAADASKTGES